MGCLYLVGSRLLLSLKCTHHSESSMKSVVYVRFTSVHNSFEQK
uniref:Uncharacterized protein n=1 Tax=Arundo donax TaxID=35708 RepID=A0A0A9DZ71_ARUDO